MKAGQAIVLCRMSAFAKEHCREVAMHHDASHQVPSSLLLSTMWSEDASFQMLTWRADQRVADWLCCARQQPLQICCQF